MVTVRRCYVVSRGIFLVVAVGSFGDGGGSFGGGVVWWWWCRCCYVVSRGSFGGGIVLVVGYVTTTVDTRESTTGIVSLQITNSVDETVALPSVVDESSVTTSSQASPTQTSWTLAPNQVAVTTIPPDDTVLVVSVIIVIVVVIIIAIVVVYCCNRRKARLAKEKKVQPEPESSSSGSKQNSKDAHSFRNQLPTAQAALPKPINFTGAHHRTEPGPEQDAQPSIRGTPQVEPNPTPVNTTNQAPHAASKSKSKNSPWRKSKRRYRNVLRAIKMLKTHEVRLLLCWCNKVNNTITRLLCHRTAHLPTRRRRNEGNR